MIGYCGISLTEFTTSAVSLIAAGSKCEIAGAWFSFTTDCTPNASSWTAITTATTAYLQLVPAGSAGTQTVSASWLTSGTVWSTAKQGWYASAASNNRVVASAYKIGPTSYGLKSVGNNILLEKSFTNTALIAASSSTAMNNTGWGIALPAGLWKITFKATAVVTNSGEGATVICLSNSASSYTCAELITAISNKVPDETLTIHMTGVASLPNSTTLTVYGFHTDGGDTACVLAGYSWGTYQPDGKAFILAEAMMS